MLRVRLQPQESRTRLIPTALYSISTIAALAVLAVLVAGLWNMMRNGSASLSQQLMRWRVGLQFAAVVIIMLTVYFTRHA